MVWDMYEPVFLPYLSYYTVLGLKLRLQYWFPFSVFEVMASTVRESHEVLVVLVASSADNSVERVDIQA